MIIGLVLFHFREHLILSPGDLKTSLLGLEAPVSSSLALVWCGVLQVELQCVFVLMDGLSPPPGERWHGGVSPVAEGAEPLLLQAADGSRSLSVFLPGLPAHHTRGGPAVPHRGLVVESLRVCCGFKLFLC